MAEVSVNGAGGSTLGRLSESRCEQLQNAAAWRLSDMPAVTITSAEFRNFKALEQYSVRFQHLNILVGPNNSGKSTVLSAFRVLAAGLRRARSKAPEYVEGLKGGYKHGYSLSGQALPISVENVHTDLTDTDTYVLFRFSNGNNLRLLFPRDGGVLLIPETTGRPIKTAASFREEYPITIGIVPVLGPVEHNEEPVENETVRRGLATHRASRHFRNYWLLYPDGFDEFAELLKKTWPGMQIERPHRVGPFGDHLAMFSASRSEFPVNYFGPGLAFKSGVSCSRISRVPKVTACW
jgi:hypothetical protein